MTKIFSSPPETNREIQQILRTLLDLFINIFLIIGFIPVVGSVSRVLQHGWKPQMFIHIGVFLFFLIIAQNKRKLSIQFIAWFITLFLIINGFSNMASFGLASMATLSFIFSIVFATLFIGMKAGISITVFITAGFTVMAWVICSNIHPMNFNTDIYLRSWSTWFAQLSFFVITAILIIVFISGLLSHLLSTLNKLRKRTDEVFDTNSLLVESEQKISTIVRTAPDSIITTDLNGNITSGNKAALELFDVASKDELKGTSLSELMMIDDKERILRDIERLKEGQIIKAVPYAVLTKNGVTRQARLSAAALKNSNGITYGLLGMLQDVSDTIQMEEQLRQSEKMQAIGQLAGGVAHDFNNQLAGIMGYADLLREEVREDPAKSHYADNILIATKRASDLTNQLLAFSRKGKYLSIPVDIHHIIAEVITILQRTIDRRITIRQHLESRSPTVTGDPTQLQNAILNIALNSRDAMPDGGELVFVTCDVFYSQHICISETFDLNPGAHISLRISDTGSGMNQTIQKKIFEPFFTTKEQGKGTGMGMASVYGTVKNHCGAIEIESAPGKGTILTLLLPLRNRDIVPEEPPDDTAHSDDNKQGAHILLVDDEDLVIGIARSMLEKSGYTVTVCRNGKDAVDFFRSNRPLIDLVLLDLMMPVMNGRDTFRVLREIDPQVKVVISSGYSIDSEAQSLLDNGAGDFIQKPYRRNELERIIQQVLNNN